MLIVSLNFLLQIRFMMIFVVEKLTKIFAKNLYCCSDCLVFKKVKVQNFWSDVNSNFRILISSVGRLGIFVETFPGMLSEILHILAHALPKVMSAGKKREIIVVFLTTEPAAHISRGTDSEAKA